MDVKDVSQRIRVAFEDPEAPELSDVLESIGTFVNNALADDNEEVDTTPDAGPIVTLFETDLFNIYENAVDHSSKQHLEAFLSILIKLGPLLPSSSVITWFDYLRPTLKDPRLSGEATSGLRAFIVSALKDAHSAESRSRDFRKRVFELYLLDASSGRTAEDTVEELNLDDEERERKRVWKENLEHILLTDAGDHPMVRLLSRYSRFTWIELRCRNFSRL